MFKFPPQSFQQADKQSKIGWIKQTPEGMCHLMWKPVPLCFIIAAAVTLKTECDY